MKFLNILIFTSILSSGLYANASEKVSVERGIEIGKKLITHPKVSPFVNLAIGQYLDLSKHVEFMGPPENQKKPHEVLAASKRLFPGSIDCDETLFIGFREDSSYCRFKATASFGWYADPYFGYSVSGYIKKDKIHEGDILTDLIITEVTIRTPVPTGAE